MRRIEFYAGTERGAHGALPRRGAARRRKDAYAAIAEFAGGATAIDMRGFWQEDPEERGICFVVITAQRRSLATDVDECAERLRVIFDQTAIRVTSSPCESHEVRAHA